MFDRCFDRIVSFLLENCRYQKIALQFPNDLLRFAPAIASRLMEKTQRKIFILADTQYSSCCVDEIAAMHTDVDIIVHFGDACLTATSRLPVYYVYPQKTGNLVSFKSSVIRLLEEKQNISKYIYLICDSVYEDFAISCEKYLASYSDNLDKKWSLIFERPTKGFVDVNENMHHEKNESQIDHDQTTVLYIGDNDEKLSCLQLKWNGSKLLHFNPATNEFHVPKCTRLFNKRFLNMSKAIESSIIGIIVGTLSAFHYIELVEATKAAIEKCGKRAIVINVGKLNAAKLANFPEVDIFTLIACPESSILDSKDFYRPVITVFELFAALSGRECLPYSYEFSFDKLMNLLETIKEKDDYQEPCFSLASGRMVSRSTDVDDTEAHPEKKLVMRQENIVSLIRNSNSVRSWNGLEIDVSQPVAKATQGRTGVARKYLAIE